MQNYKSNKNEMRRKKLFSSIASLVLCASLMVMPVQANVDAQGSLPEYKGTTTISANLSLISLRKARKYKAL